MRGMWQGVSVTLLPSFGGSIGVKELTINMWKEDVFRFNRDECCRLLWCEKKKTIDLEACIEVEKN